VDTVVYVDGLDHIGWHSDSDQGATTATNIILDAGQSVRPVLVREKGMKSAHPKARLELKLETGTLFVMDKQMQQHYDHMVSKTTGRKGHLEKNPRIVVVFRYGQRTIVNHDSGAYASISSRMYKQPKVRFGVVPHILEGKNYLQKELQLRYSHRVGVRGVNGNMTDGVNAIITSNTNVLLGESNGKSANSHVLLHCLNKINPLFSLHFRWCHYKVSLWT